MEVLSVNEIFVHIIKLCPIDVLYGLSTNDPNYVRSAVAYFGIDDYYIGIKLLSTDVVKFLCTYYELPSTEKFSMFVSYYDHKYLFVHRLQMSYIKLRWNDSMDVEKHLVDAARNLNTENMDFIMTRERLYFSWTHIALIIKDAYEDEQFCQYYAEELSYMCTYFDNLLHEERIKKGLDYPQQYEPELFVLAAVNGIWHQPCTIVVHNFTRAAIMENKLDFIKNPRVPEEWLPCANFDLNREGILRSIASAIQYDTFDFEMLEYYGVGTDEITIDYNGSFGGIAPSFNVFCKLRDMGYLTNNNYSPYHYLYDVQRGVQPQDLQYHLVKDPCILFVLFMKSNDNDVKLKCSRAIFETSTMMNDGDYYPYIIRKVCEFNRSVAEKYQSWIEDIVLNDPLMEEWCSNFFSQ